MEPEIAKYEHSIEQLDKTETDKFYYDWYKRILDDNRLKNNSQETDNFTAGIVKSDNIDKLIGTDKMLKVYRFIKKE